MNTNRSDSERLMAIETTVRDIKARLFGDDGEGGRLGSYEERITKLENWRWWVVGIAVGLGMAVGGAGKQLLAAILK